MTDEDHARAEAEEIVDALYDAWYRQPSYPAVTERQVVAVLAAAIEVQEADDASSGFYREDQIEQMFADGIDFSHAVTRLCEALSELRISEEET